MNRKYVVALIGFLLLFSFACSSINQVTPKQWDDTAIEADVRKALAENIHTKSLGLSVKVDHQVVTLDGHVDTNEQRREAGSAANGVDGVKSVINNITVK